MEQTIPRFLLRGLDECAKKEVWLGIPEQAKLERVYTDMTTSLLRSLSASYRNAIDRASKDTKQNDRTREHEVARVCWMLRVPFSVNNTVESTVGDLIRAIGAPGAERVIKFGLDRQARLICADWSRYAKLCRETLESKEASYQSTRADTFELALSRITWKTLWNNPAWNNLPEQVRRNSSRATFKALGRADPNEPGIVETMQVELTALDLPDVKLLDVLPSFCGEFVRYFAEQAAKLSVREDRYTRIHLFSAYARSHRHRVDLMAVPTAIQRPEFYQSLPDPMNSWIGPGTLANLESQLRRSELVAGGHADSKQLADLSEEEDSLYQQSVIEEAKFGPLPELSDIPDRELGMAILSTYLTDIYERLMVPIAATSNRVRSVVLLRDGLAGTEMSRAKLSEDMENYFSSAFEVEDVFGEMKAFCEPYPHPSSDLVSRLITKSLGLDAKEAIEEKDRRDRHDRISAMKTTIMSLLTALNGNGDRQSLALASWEPFPRLYRLLTEFVNRFPQIVAATPQLIAFQAGDLQARLANTETTLRVALSTLAATWSSFDDEYAEGHELAKLEHTAFASIYNSYWEHRRSAAVDSKQQQQQQQQQQRQQPLSQSSPFYYPPWINRRMLSRSNPFDVKSVEGQTKEGMLHAFYHTGLSQLDGFWTTAASFLRNWSPLEPFPLDGSDLKAARLRRLQHAHEITKLSPGALTLSDIRQISNSRGIDLHASVGYGRLVARVTIAEEDRIKRQADVPASERKDEKSADDVAFLSVLKVYVNYREKLAEQTEQELAQTMDDVWIWSRTNVNGLAMSPEDSLRELAAVIFLTFLRHLHQMCAEKARAWVFARSRPVLERAVAAAAAVAVAAPHPPALEPVRRS
jgi:hypothetical protein